jgi:hypothetical protein
MARALARYERDFYTAAFRRLCTLAGTQDDPSEPLIRATWEAVAANEQVLFEKHGRRQQAQRTRAKLDNKGVYQSLVEWSQLKGNRIGFERIIEAGMADLTFEAVVCRFADRFPPEVVANCRDTLMKAKAAA